MSVLLETEPSDDGACLTQDTVATANRSGVFPCLFEGTGVVRYWSFGTEVTRDEFEAIYPGFLDRRPRWARTLTAGFLALGRPMPTRENPGAPFPPGSRLRERPAPPPVRQV